MSLRATTRNPSLHCPQMSHSRNVCTLFGRVEGLYGGNLSQLSGSMQGNFLRQEVGPGF